MSWEWVLWPFWPETGIGYAFFSCFAGSLSIVGLLWHRFNCHEPRCLRIGRYHVAGGEYVVCARHHPDGKPTRERIHAAHRAHKAQAGPHPHVKRLAGQVADLAEATRAALKAARESHHPTGGGTNG
jgi:hypothetical protein